MGTESSRTHILVLNYNGRALLEECLPSIVVAAANAPMPCGVTVIDNDSTDSSREYLLESWPEVAVVVSPNRGLASFNAVLEPMTERVVLLLNNDVKLGPGAVAPLVEAIERHPDALFSAPLCWSKDGSVYEGMRTRVRWHFGLVQGMSRVPGHESMIHQSDLTAAAGPVLAVDRERFLHLGGYDPLYFPGRIEDLDLGFRGWMAGWRGYYAPQSPAFHHGFATFGPELGMNRCEELALRNTLLFAWKNLRGWRRLAHLGWLPVRLLHAVAMRKQTFLCAFMQAVPRWRGFKSERHEIRLGSRLWIARQEAFFARFRW